MRQHAEVKIDTTEEILEKVSILALMNERKRVAAALYEEQLVFGYEGGLFKADPVTIAMARLLLEAKIDPILIDINKNPVRISNAHEFLEEITFVYSEASTAYAKAIERIATQRTREEPANV